MSNSLLGRNKMLVPGKSYLLCKPWLSKEMAMEQLTTVHMVWMMTSGMVSSHALHRVAALH